MIIIASSLTALLGCATPRTLVLRAPAVSMTEISFDAGAKFSSAGAIKSRFCPGDNASTDDGDLNIGLIDELIAKAQKTSGAKYIANAQFFTQGNCMLLEGTSMK